MRKFRRQEIGRRRFTAEVDLTEPLELTEYTTRYLNSINVKPRRCLKCFKFMIRLDDERIHSDCDIAVKYFAHHREKKAERKLGIQ